MNSTNATMLAVTVSNGQLLVDHKRRAPVRHKNEALVRVALAGICSTDLEIIKGYFGFEGILGHEFVGQVAQCDQPQWLGKRVVASINFADAMSPEYSEFGFEHHPHRQVLGIHNRDGAMAQWVCIPVANLYEVPEDLSDRRAVFTEPVAAALRIAV
ncbi:MAG: alcohol dehydrogenase catalytic domain-containing protein, partial [Planctomycetales bacterium]|nr:alcohol dehydrogenase catalytic domain-containing protein [Planctomycetales bacterium]